MLRSDAGQRHGELTVDRFLRETADEIADFKGGHGSLPGARILIGSQVEFKLHQDRGSSNSDWDFPTSEIVQKGMRACAGKDIFVFDIEPFASNPARIGAYNVTYDRIHLESAVFTERKTGKLVSYAVWKGSRAHDGDNRA